MRSVLILALVAPLWLVGCVSTPHQDNSTPSFYRRLDAPQARFEPQGMAQLINAWRAKHKLPALSLDPALTDEAMKAARRDAEGDRSVHGVMPQLARADLTHQIARPSAGYRTAAEAFSGWRDSPGLNAAMLDPQARRLGLGAAAKAGSKYGVYWMLIVAP